MPNGTDYAYDYNGNLYSRTNSSYSANNISSINYNVLNLPNVVTAGSTVTYTYDANGRKLRKTITSGSSRDYINGIEYRNGSIDFVQTEEGRAMPGSPYVYQYNLRDQLGNNRINFNSSGAVLQADDYYPFGLEISRTTGNPKNEYLYNGKEKQEEVGTYDYGARFYDPVIGRWGVVDSKAGEDSGWSPYVYGFNNPIRFIDFDGKKPTPQEAAAIAAHVYGDQSNKILIGGWHPSSVGSGYSLNDNKTGLNSAVYERTVNGITEYVYASAGTTTLKDVGADLAQLAGGSDQYAESVSFARKLDTDLQGSELTFVGHSLGGGEASADALATGRSAVTFNAAGLSNATKNNLLLYQKC